MRAFVDGGALHVEVRDDGTGGASNRGHTGLLGLHDRAAALDGDLRVSAFGAGGQPRSGSCATSTAPGGAVMWKSAPNSENSTRPAAAPP